MDVKALFGLTNKNVVITGAGSGMGKAGAKLLHELGANVYATVRRKPLDFPVTKEIKTDLCSESGIHALISELPKTIDALFICHGISNSLGNSNALEVQLTNFQSFQRLTELLLPRISDKGSVTFIASDGGKNWKTHVSECLDVIACKSWNEAQSWYEMHPELTSVGYTFAKECQIVYVMSKCHAPEFINRKIRLNAIAPGLTRTGLTDDFNKSLTGNAQQGQSILEHLYLSSWNGHWATPEEMGYPMVALGSQLFSYVSGQIIYINYGLSSKEELENFQKTNL